MSEKVKPAELLLEPDVTISEVLGIDELQSG